VSNAKSHTETDQSPEGDPPGIDVANVTAWFETHAAEVTAPLSFDLITGGRSNLTYRVTDAEGRRWALRRPPLGHVLATAHDMHREHRIIAALQNSSVPVPPAVGLCEDDDVNGAPFYVMDFVEGRILRGREDAEALDLSARQQACEDMADVLARIHLVDPDKVGLGDLGRKEGYIERQLRRWSDQWEKSKTRELPMMDDVHAGLTARVPAQGPAAIVHGDYRLDNCMVGDDGHVVAVLDWELCTLGDPLADVGLLLVYWSEAGDSFAALGESAATTADGFATRDELVKKYAEARARNSGAEDPRLDEALAGINYYVAFGYWKLACILEGVYARYRAGVMGESDGYEGFAHAVEMLAQNALSTLDAGGDR
jgi:aminoglycoside phosphotransferase (APT) family kinase protein